MNDSKSVDSEKKSERFEVRLSHSKKRAFQDACDQQGDTPSDAVRRFIESYLRRNQMDTLSHAFRVLTRVFRENWKSTLAAFLIGFPVAFYFSAI